MSVRLTKRRFLAAGALSVAGSGLLPRHLQGEEPSQVLAALGSALLPQESDVQQAAWARLWERLGNDKAHWLRAFADALAAREVMIPSGAGSTAIGPDAEAAVASLLEEDDGRFGDFLDQLYEAAALEPALMASVYPHGLFRVGYADPDFLRQWSLMD